RGDGTAGHPVTEGIQFKEEGTVEEPVERVGIGWRIQRQSSPKVMHVGGHRGLDVVHVPRREQVACRQEQLSENCEANEQQRWAECAGEPLARRPRVTEHDTAENRQEDEPGSSLTDPERTKPLQHTITLLSARRASRTAYRPRRPLRGPGGEVFVTDAASHP